ncbi:protein of unknown function [Moritella yayanosii]|uniref:Uncharacterized protein n=1 Tax=Moritella yayanosii TaxID=69539 RepID=A0A330LY78_9GAMM|nr:protein of unknown function [Moritella yayanosii]
MTTASSYSAQLAINVSPSVTNAVAQLCYQGSFGPTLGILFSAQQVTRQE